MATNTEDDAAETIVIPPDHLIARELAESPIKKKSTSSSSSKISLQESTKCIRMTPAAKRREDMAEKMLSLYEKEQQRELEEVDDEYVMSFISMAKRINSLLDKRQKERVLQEGGGRCCKEIHKSSFRCRGISCDSCTSSTSTCCNTSSTEFQFKFRT